MQAGKLRHALTLERLEITQDELGQPIETWVNLGTVRASVEGVSGREFLAADASQAETTWRITTRYRADIEPACRFVDGASVFNVVAVLPDNRRRQVTLMCKTA